MSKEVKDISDENIGAVNDMPKEVKEVQFTLPLETINLILNYLADKPYKETAELISKIQREVKKI